MIDVLATLSGLVKHKKFPKAAKRPEVTNKSAKTRKQSDATKHVQPVSDGRDIAELEAIKSQISQATLELRSMQTKAQETIVEANREALRIKREAEVELKSKEEHLYRRIVSAEEREKRLEEIEVEKKKALSSIEEVQKEALSQLEKIAHMTREEAREKLLSDLRIVLKADIAKEIKDALAQAHEEAEVKAREIVVDAMRHGAIDYVAEFTVSVVKITDEDMKGRIIGKEGRNIRAFETATGVDVDLDEEGVIRLSSFDPVRREIARVALERLLRDGRVQPGRIEEIIAQVKKEIERIMFEEGQKLCHAVGVYNLPPPLVAMLGRFKYRFSYGQNMITHTMEETKISMAIAREVGADINIVRLGCLLHDIGKVVTDKEGSHVELGVDLLKKYGMPQKVIDCVAQHHEDTPFTSIEALIVYIGDAISGGRPGARYENYEEYVKRLKDLEEIAKSQEGVAEAYAFQAGRELRIIVDPGKVDDATATILARSVKEQIEKKMTYPGQVKVTVIRELRAVEIAK